MKTQNDRLLEYLASHDGITQREAMDQLGIMRLASRVSDLRRHGHRIVKRTVSVANRWGEKCHIAEYRMVRDERK